MSMRERIAMRLVGLYAQNDGPLDGLTEADAVLDELMTPTEGMEDAGWDGIPDDESKFNPETIFTSMIKAAKDGK